MANSEEYWVEKYKEEAEKVVEAHYIIGWLSGQLKVWHGYSDEQIEKLISEGIQSYHKLREERQHGKTFGEGAEEGKADFGKAPEEAESGTGA